MCEHLTSGRAIPEVKYRRIAYPIGMINAEYHWGSKVEMGTVCPVCNEWNETYQTKPGEVIECQNKTQWWNAKKQG